MSKLFTFFPSGKVDCSSSGVLKKVKSVGYNDTGKHMAAPQNNGWTYSKQSLVYISQPELTQGGCQLDGLVLEKAERISSLEEQMTRMRMNYKKSSIRLSCAIWL